MECVACINFFPFIFWKKEKEKYNKYSPITLVYTFAILYKRGAVIPPYKLQLTSLII